MIWKSCLVTLSLMIGLTGHAAVPPGMQDTELKDTLTFLGQQKQSVDITHGDLMASAALIGSGAILGQVGVLMLSRSTHARIVKLFPELTVGRAIGIGSGLIALGVAYRLIVMGSRANFDRDYLIERQHFADLNRYFNSSLQVQYLIASENSELRDYLIELAAWIKANRANEESLVPALKYQTLVPTHQ